MSLQWQLLSIYLSHQERFVNIAAVISCKVLLNLIDFQWVFKLFTNTVKFIAAKIKDLEVNVINAYSSHTVVLSRTYVLMSIIFWTIDLCFVSLLGFLWFVIMESLSTALSDAFPGDVDKTRNPSLPASRFVIFQSIETDFLCVVILKGLTTIIRISFSVITSIL